MKCIYELFSAVGCTNMIPPDNAWLRRSKDDIIIGCYSSQQTWQLKCDGREWKGLVGTCPELCKSNVNHSHNRLGQANLYSLKLMSFCPLYSLYLVILSAFTNVCNV